MKHGREYAGFITLYTTYSRGECVKRMRRAISNRKSADDVKGFVLCGVFVLQKSKDCFGRTHVLATGTGRLIRDPKRGGTWIHLNLHPACMIMKTCAGLVAALGLWSIAKAAISDRALHIESLSPLLVSACCYAVAMIIGRRGGQHARFIVEFLERTLGATEMKR